MQAGSVHAKCEGSAPAWRCCVPVLQQLTASQEGSHSLLSVMV
jgi:hypothetical protein